MRKRFGPGAGLLNLCFASMAIALLTLSHVASAADSNSAAEIVVTFMSGNVVVTHQGQQNALRVGGKLGLPASIRTGGDGTIELRQSRTTVTIAANSSLEIPVTGLASGKIDRVTQSSGSVFYRVEPRETQKLRVETPYLVAVIKGTQFNVVVQPDNSTVALFEGMLQIAAPDDSDSVDLNAGEIAIRYGTDTRIRVLRMNTGETLRAQLAVPVTPTIQNAAATPIVNGLAGALPGSSVTNAVAAATSAAVPPASISVPVNAIAVASSNSALTNGAGIGSAASLKGAGVAAAAAIGGTGINVNTNVGAATNLGGVSANVGLGANANLGAGSVGLNTSVSVGAASAAISSSIGSTVNIGTGGVGLTADVGASVGAANSSIGATTSIGLSANTSLSNAPSVALSADVATAATVGSTAATVTAAPSLNVGAGSVSASATAGVGLASPVGAVVPAATIGASVGVTPGSVSTTVSVGTLNIGASIPLDTGLLGNAPATGSTTTSAASALPVAPAPNPVNNNGGLLGRLRILNGKK